MESLLTSYGKIFGVTIGRYMVIAGVFFLVFYVWRTSRFSRAKIQTRIAGKKDFLREIFYSVQTTFVLAATGILVMQLSAHGYTRIYHDLSKSDIWYIPLSLFLSLVIHDTYFYWMHRALHHPVIFKYAHVVHHKSVTPSPWASYSFHLLEAIPEGLVLLPIVFILPMHKITILLFVLVGFVINVYGHLGYEIASRRLRGSMFFHVLNTSVHHNLHHSKFKGNYGLYFRFWDRLMKTELPEYVATYDKIQEQRFGETASADTTIGTTTVRKAIFTPAKGSGVLKKTV